jgi:hypothetical protein
MAKTDSVAAAKRAVTDAGAALEKESKRLEAASKRADDYAREAADVDPDDAKAFERATRTLAERRAEVDLLGARKVAAVAKLEAARASLLAAEAADAAARIAALEEQIAEAELIVRDRLLAFAAELGALGTAQAARVAEVGRLGPPRGALKLGARSHVLAVSDPRGVFAAAATLV